MMSPTSGALHVTVWSTVLAPTTSLRFLSASGPNQPFTSHSRLASVAAIGFPILFFGSIAPSSYFMARTHQAQFNAVDALLLEVDIAQAQNLPITTLVTLILD